MFGSWPLTKLKHNHAVALYSLGLVHQLLGSDQEAWEYYDKALEGFQKAESQWPSMKVTDDWKARCTSAEKRIQELMDYVTRARTLGGSSVIQLCTLVGCIPLSVDLLGTDQFIVDVDVKRIRLDLHLRLGDREYKLLALGENEPPELTLDPSEEYYVLPTSPGLGDLIPQFQKAQYALLSPGRPDQTKEFGASVERGKEILWGEFTRDTDGKIQFEVAYTDPPAKPPRIIGGEDLQKKEERRVGKVVGVFKAA